MDRFVSNGVYGKQLALTFPLRSDWGRPVTKVYGLFNDASGFGNRATFVVDKEGKIQQIVRGGPAVDITSTLDTCNVLDKKLVVAPPKP